ncbi:MAG: type II toxin-antitoxin system PemK/MazF family toxin [Deltaproteobacteria bacterium]|nr:type II toxin-antitoxin system PemK/MazF family toxin [Deltaproteobacteria bacterium]
MIRQGDVFWADLRGLGSEPLGRRPVLVVQHDRFNRSAIATTVVAALTTNLRLAAAPGNVCLRRGEANLPRSSVVNVTQLHTLDRTRLVGHIGTLSRTRREEIAAGLGLVLGPPAREAP